MNKHAIASKCLLALLFLTAAGVYSFGKKDTPKAEEPGGGGFYRVGEITLTGGLWAVGNDPLGYYIFHEDDKSRSWDIGDDDLLKILSSDMHPVTIRGQGLIRDMVDEKGKKFGEAREIRDIQILDASGNPLPDKTAPSPLGEVIVTGILGATKSNKLSHYDIIDTADGYRWFIVSEDESRAKFPGTSMWHHKVTVRAQGFLGKGYTKPRFIAGSEGEGLRYMLRDIEILEDFGFVGGDSDAAARQFAKDREAQNEYTIEAVAKVTGFCNGLD
jgi:hypothetical protein